MIKAILETPVGRAFRIFWDDLLMWVIGNILFASSLVPGALALFSNNLLLMVLLSILPIFVLASVAAIMAKPLRETAPRWSDMQKVTYKAVFSVWLAVIASAGLFALPGLVVQSIVVVLVIILSPIALLLPNIYPTNMRSTWRNAFVVAVHFPIYALGFPALAFIFGWLISVTSGALLIVLPALWLVIVLVSLQEMSKQIQNASSSEN